MVHHWMLPSYQQHLDDREYCHSPQGASPGIGAVSGRGIKPQPVQSIGKSEGGGNCSGADECRVRRHVTPLNSATAPMLSGWEDAEHGLVGEGGAVPYRLHTGDRL